ncbi:MULTISPECIES: MFS transporter [Pseudoalteromonas]|uniref:MFS transporter n=1 Tax=Pseudoalteromonas TaxID=53246 RepID=UPI0005F9ADC0|nr:MULTISPECIES: MFS transporter [Pseudoalteromonas]KJZ02485.1 diguanylate cyclase [Pseudoalteromonas piscicida]ODB33406.1 diguanylate cyclase [Pseudoalteromonas sp. BMB]
MNQTRLATWFLLLASTMTVLASATLAPALPAMTVAFSGIEHAAFWTKMTLALPGLVIALCAPIAGSLVDKWNSQKLLVNALILFVLSGGLGYYWQDSLWLILGSRAMMGVAVAFIMVSGTTIAGRYFEGPQFSQFMGLQAAFGGFGGVLFLALAGFLAEQHWTWVFAIYSLALLVLPGVWLWVKVPPVSLPPQTQSLPSSWMNRTFLLCCTLALVEIIVLYGLTIHLPFYLSAQQVSASTIGLVIAGFLFAMSCVSMGYGRVRQYLNIKQAHIVGWLIVATGFSLLGFVNTFSSIVCASFIIGAGLGLIRPNLVVWLFEFVPPPMRGKAMGIMTTCYFTGQFISPVLFEPMIASLGFQLFFIYLAMTIASVAVLVAGIYLLNQKTWLKQPD